MKTADNQRSELLNELFPTSEAPSVEATEVLRWVADERMAQRRRRRYVSGAAAVLGAGLLVAFPLRRAAIVDQSSHKIAPELPEAATPVIVAAPTAPAVERIDDEALLGLLDDTPAAMVQWPDGRRSLLVLVRNQVQQ